MSVTLSKTTNERTVIPNGEKDGWTLYVIDLRKTVLKRKKFRAENPHYITGKPCVYVGCTCKTSQQRFAQHLKEPGERPLSSRVVKDFGKRIRENECRKIKPMSRKAAYFAEAQYAEELRERGWAVWQK